MRISTLLRGIAASALVCASSLSFAASAVWLVEKDGKQLYLGGTVHILTKNDFPLPKEYDKAFEAADTLVLETDVLALEKPEMQPVVMQAMMYTDGRTLTSVLNEDARTALNNYLQTRGMGIAAMNGFRAGAVSVTLSLMELQVMGYQPEGVDTYYARLATKNGLPIQFLETVDEQLGFLSNMGEGYENSLIKQTLEDIKQLPVMMPKMITAWRESNIDNMDEYILADMRESHPQVYQELLVSRNNTWMPEIEAMLKTDEVEAVFVGAGHLAGDKGLLTLLAKKGYNISQL